MCLKLRNIIVAIYLNRCSSGPTDLCAVAIFVPAGAAPPANWRRVQVWGAAGCGSDVLIQRICHRKQFVLQRHSQTNKSNVNMLDQQDGTAMNHRHNYYIIKTQFDLFIDLIRYFICKVWKQYKWGSGKNISVIFLITMSFITW